MDGTMTLEWVVSTTRRPTSTVMHSPAAVVNVRSPPWYSLDGKCRTRRLAVRSSITVS